MAVDAVAQAKDVALLLYPLLVGVAHAFFDAGMARRLERAREMPGIVLPKGADQGAAAFDVGFVLHGDVGLDKGLEVAHALDMAPPARHVDDPRGNRKQERP